MLRISFFFLLVFCLLITLNGCTDDNPVEPEIVHFEAIGLYIITGNDTIVTYVGGIVDGQIEVSAGNLSAQFGIIFVKEDGDTGIPEATNYSLDWKIMDEQVAGLVALADELRQYRFRIEGKQAGTTSITIILNHNDHKDFESKDIPVHVLASG